MKTCCSKALHETLNSVFGVRRPALFPRQATTLLHEQTNEFGNKAGHLAMNNSFPDI
jgi:hypothetical protein